MPRRYMVVEPRRKRAWPGAQQALLPKHAGGAALHQRRRVGKGVDIDGRAQNNIITVAIGKVEGRAEAAKRAKISVRPIIEMLDARPSPAANNHMIGARRQSGMNMFDQGCAIE